MGRSMDTERGAVPPVSVYGRVRQVYGVDKGEVYESA